MTLVMFCQAELVETSSKLSVPLENTGIWISKTLDPEMNSG